MCIYYPHPIITNQYEIYHLVGENCDSRAPDQAQGVAANWDGDSTDAQWKCKSLHINQTIISITTRQLILNLIRK